ncbi:monocarboxylate transporter 9-like [Tubulanus polymorphus]|uniref:monocarboxylate transporter 9-like n=1 Tax=Tubulanus polymorphus TaxID=672921 RepID=UPI003DA4B99F
MADSDSGKNHVDSNRLEMVVRIIAGSISTCIIGGNYGDGILVAEWMDYFLHGSGDTAWLGTVVLGIGFCGGPIAGLMMKRFGFRKVFVIASIINASAITVTSFVYNFYLALALRVIAGCGVTVHISTLGS